LVWDGKDWKSKELNVSEETASAELAKNEEEQQDRMLIPLDEAPITMKTLQTLMGTPTVPTRYRESKTGVADMYAAHLVGKELGIGTMEAINSIFLVNGSVSMLGRLMCAQIYRHGHAINVAVSPKKVTTTAFRRDPYTHKLERHGEWTFTEGDAKKAYLDSKGTYENYPQLMWAWRSISAISRIYFADCISGVGHIPEEMGLDVPVEPIPDFVDLEVDGGRVDLEQASATVEEIMGAGDIMDHSINKKEKVVEAEVVDE